ncbi:MAG: CDP-diacylglycerol--serine O-phosphatidyltransferase [Cytophagales bacterium]|nr:CDP-diacylglycerol--serine O-phosphatidyltransferase [Cytophagales bacterium]
MIKKHIPNFLTCCNLLCGCVGLVFTFEEKAPYAVYLVWLAMLFDFLDGFTARILKAFSPMGKELDSLADLVTFGVLPSVILFKMISAASPHPYLPFLAFIIAVFSALRLAKFNIDDRQQTVFIGLPTPANALFLSSLVFVDDLYPQWLTAPVLLVITVLFSLLLVAPIELFSLKFKSFNWKGNEVRFLFLGAGLVLVLLCWQLALPLIIIAYLLISVVVKAFSSS